VVARHKLKLDVHGVGQPILAAAGFQAGVARVEKIVALHEETEISGTDFCDGKHN
jgi:hypothetical protein